MKVLLFLLLFSVISAQKFQIIYRNNNYSTAYIADKNGKIIKKLDDSFGLNYRPGTMGYFSIFAINGEEGWTAVDINGKKLFQVLNSEIGTPSPDDVIDGKIRIVGKNGKIGFADEKGKVIIRPQFEEVSSFHKGKAIIGEGCKAIPWTHSQETDCRHYYTQCKKYGYIDEKGKIIEFGEYTFEEIAKKIKWEQDYSETSP